MIESLAAHPHFYWLLEVAVVAVFAVSWIVRAFLIRKRRRYALAAMREDEAIAADGGVSVAVDSVLTRDVLVSEVESALRISLERDEQGKLPDIYLTLARHSLAAREPIRARDYLLQCVRTATMTGQSEIHARARFHLG